MKIYEAVSSEDFRKYDTEQIRSNFLIENVFCAGEIVLNYSHDDRIVFGGAVPTTSSLELVAGVELKCEYFLQRREMGIINVGGQGSVVVDNRKYTMKNLDCIYIGKNSRKVEFSSDNSEVPAQFYINSCPAHSVYPTVHMPISEATPVDLGSKAECNERTIHKFIYPQGIQSCQLVMGLTKLKEGSIWNTMPCHTHERRMEVYLYFDIPKDNVVFHYMGKPSQTRHLVVQDRQAIISPSWSIHSGCGTKNYTFIWGMCGENQDFDDMDKVRTIDLK